MSTEAATVEPGTEAPAEGTPPVEGQPTAPETPPEGTPEGTPPEGSNDTPPEPSGQPPEGDAQIQMYQDVLRKSKEDSSYQMTDEEAEAFLNVQDQIAEGTLEDPGPATEKPAEKPPETPPEEGDTTPPSSDQDTDTPLIDGMTEETSRVLMSAMDRVGAKDLSELDGKIEGLIKTMKSSGGKLGSEVKAMKEREQSHISWIQELKAGTPEAMAYLEKITGRKFTPQPAKEGDSSSIPSGASEPPEDGDLPDEEFLDDKLAAEVRSLKKMVKTQAETIEKLSKGEQQRAEANERKTAADGWVDDVVDLVVDPQTQGAFKLSAGEARALAQQYWGPDGHTKAVHPKFQPIHELIKFANERSMPDLRSAFIVWQHETGFFAKKLIQAKKEGGDAVQRPTSKNSFISKKQKNQPNVPQSNISEEDVSRMERGDFDAIPDEWMDDEGNLLPDKVPERFHAAAFGKLGKPK